MSDASAMGDVPADREMPAGGMQDPDIVVEQEEMPAGGMEEGE